MISIGIKVKFALWEIYHNVILKYDCQMGFSLFQVKIYSYYK